MAELAYEFKSAIEDGSLHHMGELLKENWALKKSLTAGISNSDIDHIYDTGISSGALGGKLLGAGAGGFIMFLAPKSKHEQIRQNLSHLRAVDFNLESSGSKVIYYGE